MGGLKKQLDCYVGNRYKQHEVLLDAVEIHEV